MADVRTLENEIKRLQRELQDSQQEKARIINREITANENKLKQLQRDISSGRRKLDENTLKEYETLMRNYQNSMNREIQNKQLSMDTQYQNLLASIQLKEQEWREKTSQLNREVEMLKKRTEQRDFNAVSEANNYFFDLGNVYKDVDKKPHKKFYPGRMRTIYNAISDGQKLVQNGLGQAAIAIFISARSGLNRLGFDVDEKLEEWMRQYTLFESKTEILKSKLDNELSDWYKNVAQGTGELTVQDKNDVRLSVDYWSQGEYGRLREALKKYTLVTNTVKAQGIEKYLQSDNSLDLEQLKAAIEELDKLETDFEKLSKKCRANYAASCQRCDWGEKIIDFLENEINLRWLDEESGYRPVDASMAENPVYKEYMIKQYGPGYEQADTRQWLELVFKNSIGTIVFVYIIPYESGENIENRLVLYLDYAQVPNDEYSESIYRHICEGLDLQEDDGLVCFAREVNQLTQNNNKELRETGQAISTKRDRIK